MANLVATKPIEVLMNEAQQTGEHTLKRSLGPISLVMLGIGAVIGAGLFVRTAAAIADRSGASVTIAFVIAGIGCAFAGLCYAEFSTMIPVAGSAYTYSYATLGELIAWIIGWDLVLEYAVGAATVSVSWSKYLIRLLGTFGITFPAAFTKSPFEGGVVNLPAIFIICAISIVLIIGIQESARFNGFIVALKVSIVVLVIGLGFAYINHANYVPFIPPNTGEFGHFGWSGVMRAAGVI